MSSTQSLLDNTTTSLAVDQPLSPVRFWQGRRHRLVEVGAGIGLLAAWLVIGFLLGLGFVGFVMLTVPLLAAFQTLVRRRSLRSLLARDTISFARRWPGKVLVAAVLIIIPAAMVLLSLSGGRSAMVLLSLSGGRYGRYADDSW